jgi:hypothetical protein
MLADKLRKEISDEQEEFHVRAPRRYFLDFIENEIKKSDKHVAKLLDFRKKIFPFSLIKKSRLFDDLHHAWNKKYGTESNLPTDQQVIFDKVDFGNENPITYKEGRLYLSCKNAPLVYSGGVYSYPELDITECKVSQLIILSDEMYENRMNILKEEGFIVENMGEEEVFRRTCPDPSCKFTIDLVFPGIQVPVFCVKL